MLILKTKHFRILFLLILILSTSCKEKQSKKSELVKDEPKSEWTPIFNGKDLSGWTMKINGYPLAENFGNTFRVEDGILSIRYDQYGPELGERFGALFYDKELSNYRLKVEYRFVGETASGAPEWGYRDSGVQIHTQPPNTVQLNQRFPICLEYNLHGGNGTDDRPLGAICGIGTFVEIDGAKSTSFCNPAKVARTFHGDQWVTVEIDVRDGIMKHFVNGEEIMNYSNPTYDPENEFAKELIKDGDLTVDSGYISFQSNSHPIDFRKIELLEY
ncbi:DUF1080 domain-containing protein [Aurantibacter crassamenti]|uniref:3-keto-disaccharide hydrolase n=1 Tax=Aurantibacter crassamenti TaxID=1837375 RepID=UPI0019398664|nr:DUF1080 domain-containing protein [Aurantibacter crassamenti]MBM1105592.1 DUF1080 domain-containing protein [Aurantibacter crassamenti]